METFKINANNKEFNVRPLEEKDQILYEIFIDDKLQCVIGLNDEGEWEANNDYDPSIVKEIGYSIEDDEDSSELEFDIDGDPQPDDVDIP